MPFKEQPSKSGQINLRVVKVKSEELLVANYRKIGMNGDGYVILDKKE